MRYMTALSLLHIAAAFRVVPTMVRRSSSSSSLSMMSATPISYKVGFMFPGQGAQAVGMAGPLCAELPAAKALFDKASEILGYDLLAKCVNGPKEELDSTVVSQPAIFVSSMAALEKLKAEDPAAVESCTVTMGLSLGEYTALCFAGAFSFEDGVKLTKARGEAMQAAADASSSGMVAVIGLDIPTVEKVCAEATAKTGKPIAIANYLVDGNYAVSGAKEACAAVQEIAPTMGARMAVPLSVAGAFHTDFMAPAVDRLKKVCYMTVPFPGGCFSCVRVSMCQHPACLFLCHHTPGSCGGGHQDPAPARDFQRRRQAPLRPQRDPRNLGQASGLPRAVGDDRYGHGQGARV